MQQPRGTVRQKYEAVGDPACPNQINSLHAISSFFDGSFLEVFLDRRGRWGYLRKNIEWVCNQGLAFETWVFRPKIEELSSEFESHATKSHRNKGHNFFVDRSCPGVVFEPHDQRAGQLLTLGDQKHPLTILDLLIEDHAGPQPGC